VCAARATTIHKADPDYKVMITAEKPSADSVNISDMIDICKMVMLSRFVCCPSR